MCPSFDMLKWSTVLPISIWRSWTCSRGWKRFESGSTMFTWTKEFARRYACRPAWRYDIITYDFTGTFCDKVIFYCIFRCTPKSKWCTKQCLAGKKTFLKWPGEKWSCFNTCSILNSILLFVATQQRFEDLPINCQRYILRLEELAGVPVKWIGVGPGRDDVITKL